MGLLGNFRKHILLSILTLALMGCSGSFQGNLLTTDENNSGSSAPIEDLGSENIGTKTRIYNTFDSWKLNSSVLAGRGSTYAEVTNECAGKIESAYALTAEQWNDPVQRKIYFKNLNQLMSQVANQLISDFGNPFSESEKTFFIQALKALSWQESQWQHYIRYKNWFFVYLSGGSYNALDDWGITQVARSGFDANSLLNTEYFEQKNYCQISSSLYQGFNEFIEAYMIARSQSCNQTGNILDKFAGAYNSYSSGFSTCYNTYSSNPEYKTYQIKAMNGLRSAYSQQPWLPYLN